MALYLITGTPGAGKTLNTLRMVHKRAEEEDRTVFYYGIDLIRDNPAKIDFSRWIEMQGIEHAGEPGAITPHSWQQAPDGAIILIDECHFYFPPASPNARLPDFIMDFAIHRHRGFDIYLITQGPARVNSALKDWVSPHIHFRKIWGRVVRSYENEVCVNEIRNVRAVSEAAIKRRVPEDKRWFGAYVSASVHTKNKRTPVKLLFMALFPLFVVLPLCIWYLLYYFQSLTGEAQARQLGQHQSVAAVAPGALWRASSARSSGVQHSGFFAGAKPSRYQASTRARSSGRVARMSPWMRCRWMRGCALMRWWPGWLCGFCVRTAARMSGRGQSRCSVARVSAAMGCSSKLM